MPGDAGPTPTGSLRCALRRRTMEIGMSLGWRTDEVVAFAECLTGRAWDACGQAELEVVCDEYEAIRRVIAAKRLRRTIADKLMRDGREGGP